MAGSSLSLLLSKDTMLRGFFLVVTWCCCVHRTTHAAAENGHNSGTEQRDLLLKHAVKSMLGFKELPLSDYGPRDADMAPQYMLDLYEKYKNERIQNGRMVANTVRSIHADIGLVRDNAMFIFNLSSMGLDESIISGELHVLKKPSTSSQEGGAEEEEIVSQMFRLSPSSITELGVRTVPPKGRGWQVLSTTSAVKACLRARKQPSKDNNKDLLAMYFGHRHPNGKVTSLPMSKVMRMFSRPFLVVFSNATQNISVDHVSPHYSGSSTSIRQSYVDPETGNTETFQGRGHGGGGGGRRRKGRKSHHNKEEDRVKRSIHDNELPDTEIAVDYISANVPQTNPTILQGRPPSRPSFSSAELLTSTDDGPSELSGVAAAAGGGGGGGGSRLIPYPEDYKQERKTRRRKGRRGRKNHHRKNKNKNKDRQEPRNNNKKKQNKDTQNERTLPDYWGHTYNVIETLAKQAPVPEVCGKRNLVVDFADIGWKDWIISPTSFEANYCAGTCGFPLSEGVRPSNHATIQSILQAIGIHPDVPAPCCVPDVMSSLTLLFFDENRNVVLKNYPAMTVESCACR